jgi:hypothetical protein
MSSTSDAGVISAAVADDTPSVTRRARSSRMRVVLQEFGTANDLHAVVWETPLVFSSLKMVSLSPEKCGDVPVY